MAEAALRGGHLPAEAVRAGLFGLPVSEPLAGEFLPLTAAGINYGYANRHIVAERVLDVLARHATPRQRQRPARLVRHVGHGAFETHHGAGRPARVVSRRGVQPLRWTGPAAGLPGHPLTFLTGGDSTHAYLVTAAAGAAGTGWRCAGEAVDAGLRAALLATGRRLAAATGCYGHTGLALLATRPDLASRLDPGRMLHLRYGDPAALARVGPDIAAV